MEIGTTGIVGAGHRCGAEVAMAKLPGCERAACAAPQTLQIVGVQSRNTSNDGVHR